MSVQLGRLGEPILQIKVQVNSFEENLDSKDPIKLSQAQPTLNLGIKGRQVLDWMSDTEKLLYLKNHKENKRHILKGTGEWLLPDDIYNRGKNTTTSSPLFLHDILRSGKTRLTSLVIENGLETSKQGTSLPSAFFYCSRNTTEPQGNASGILDIGNARNLILQLAALYLVTIIIIDALDECLRERRAILIESANPVVRNSSSLVKFFISSREDGDIVSHLGGFPSLKTLSGKNQVDIEAFVEAEPGRLV
ncbi:hypothetical protein F5882DRAFT_477935 [Hyaloscypha sp. PMI_1271]|nr:hypothetical protein F5882DRAFT_477935 [Hyaloscypha sp. PMI_1271]